MKFVGNKHYHEQIKWLHFRQNWNKNHWTGYNYSNRIDVSRYCSDVKPVMTP